MSKTPSETPDGVDWDRVDAAMAYLGNLDVVEMASHIVSQALAKGAKEAYNEAGSARYQLAKARQHLAYLQSTVAHESLEAQHQRIRALDRTNEKKRQMVGQTEEPAP